MPLDHDELSMIEFFSGIGGMRYATENALNLNHITKKKRTSLQCLAYDVSLHANNAYKNNFEATEVFTKLVEQLKPKDLDGKADLWTMSPPCQPFTKTKGAKTMDIDDKRCNGLKGIMDLLTTIEKKPKFIFLENVKGFADSRMIQEWYSCLQSNGYTYKQYLISPVQIGIPNHRQRYYILCERSDRWKNEIEIHCEIELNSGSKRQQHIVGDYIDNTENSKDLDEYMVPDTILQKNWSKEVGVVSIKDIATHCFTAGYGRIYHRATGSLFLMTQRDQSIQEKPIDRSDMMQYSGKLRKFTPNELLRLFGFPSSFDFPDGITREHQYKLIGNSINVTVVSLLIEELLFHNNNWTHSTSVTVGGEKGHDLEDIHGNILQLYTSYRWKMIPNCTGRYICRDHETITTLTPLQVLERVGIVEGVGKEFQFKLPGRADMVIVVPLDPSNRTGLITFHKQDRNSFVHTLNTPSGFRRKLNAIGILVTDESMSLIGAIR